MTEIETIKVGIGGSAAGGEVVLLVVRGSGCYAGRIVGERPGREENGAILDRPSL